MNLTPEEYDYLIERLAIECSRLSKLLDNLQGAQHDALEEIRNLRAENERLRLFRPRRQSITKEAKP